MIQSEKPDSKLLRQAAAKLKCREDFPRAFPPAPDGNTHNSPATVANIAPTPYLDKLESTTNIHEEVIYHYRTHKYDNGTCLLTKHLRLAISFVL